MKSLSVVLKSSLFIVMLTFLSGCGKLEMLELKGIDNFAIASFSKEGVELEMDLQIHNPNGIKFKVKDYDLDILVNNVKIGKAALREKMVLPRKTTSSHHVSVNASFTNILMGAFPVILSLKKDKNATIRIVGEVKGAAMGMTKKVDVEFQKDITLRK